MKDQLNPEQAMLQAMEDVLDEAAFGEIKRDYFKHEH